MIDFSNIENLKYNWDEHGAKPFTKKHIEIAKIFANQLNGDNWVVYPTSAKTIQIERESIVEYLEFEVYATGKIKMYSEDKFKEFFDSLNSVINESSFEHLCSILNSRRVFTNSSAIGNYIKSRLDYYDRDYMYRYYCGFTAYMIYYVHYNDIYFEISTTYNKSYLTDSDVKITYYSKPTDKQNHTWYDLAAMFKGKKRGS